MKASRVVGLVILALLVGVVLGYYSRPVMQGSMSFNQTVAPVTQTVTQQVTITTNERSPFVHVAYDAKTVDSVSACNVKPASGNVFVILSLKIENRGYGKLAVSPDFFYIIIDREHSLNPPVHTHPYAYDRYATSCTPDSLPTYDLSDGSTATGSIVYEVPNPVILPPDVVYYPGVNYNIYYTIGV